MIPGITASGRRPWTPYDLFEPGVEMAWYNPANLASMWQDTAATIPVTADGDVVARIDDSYGIGPWVQNGNPANRGVYRTDGIHHWLELDGVDDYWNAGAAGSNPLSSLTPYLSIAYSFTRTSDTGGQKQIIGNYASTIDGGYAVISTDSTSANTLIKVGSTQQGVGHGIPQNTDPRVVSYRWDGVLGTRKMYAANNIPFEAAGLIGDSDPSAVFFTIGKAATINSQYLNGNFYGVVVLAKAITDDELLKLWEYMRTISGMPI